MRPTVLVYRPNVPAAPAVYACPGCTLFASVRAAFGSAFGNVPTGLVKLVMLKRLKNSDRSSRLRHPPIAIRFDTTRSTWRNHGP